MTQSDQWKPSDIEAAAAAAAESEPAPARRRIRSSGSEPPVAADMQQRSNEVPATAPSTARPVTSGIMTLDRESGSRDNQQKGEGQAPAPDVHQRLRETADRCIRFYESWNSGNDGESELTDALHDLRRVLARIEIELAASHADESAQRPIPIPLHRAHKDSGDKRR